jgi:phospholipid/cholesterol/gamma-HCH transport system substrate-binding protein
MKEKAIHNIRVGIFIFIGFLLFVAGILILGRKRNMFQKTIRVTTIFKDIRGLRVGSNIRFTGIDVGAITNIEILSDTAVLVTFSLDKDVVPFVKSDSRTTIGTEGLMGSTIVLLLPGSPNGEPIESGDQISSVEPVDLDDIVTEIKNSSAKISDVADNLIEITEKIKRGDGIFGKLFTDSELTAEIDQTGKNIEKISGDLKELAYKINQGEGLIGRIMMDTTFANRLDISTENIAMISQNLKELTRRINEGEGMLGQLVATDTSEAGISKMTRDLQTAIANLAEVSTKLNDENNALHKFIADTSFADSVEVMLRNLNDGIIEVTEASEALQRNTLVRVFSKDEDKLKKKEQRKQQRNSN